MYVLRFFRSFQPTYRILIKGNPEKEKRTKKVLNFLRQGLFYPSLKSHKVDTKTFGKRFSSFITGDLRVIWDFDASHKQIILLFAITQHSGSHREYK